MGNLVYMEIHMWSAMSWEFAFRYIGTPGQTTLAPTTVPTTITTTSSQLCATGQMWNPHKSACISACGTIYWTADVNWSSQRLYWYGNGVPASQANGCYLKVVVSKALIFKNKFTQYFGWVYSKYSQIINV